MGVFVIRLSARPVSSACRVSTLKAPAPVQRPSAYVGSVRNDIARVKAFETLGEARRAVEHLYEDERSEDAAELMAHLTIEETHMQTLSAEVSTSQLGVDIYSVGDDGEMVLRRSLVRRRKMDLGAARARLQDDYAYVARGMADED